MGPELLAEPPVREAPSLPGASPAAVASVALNSAGVRNPCSFADEEVLVGFGTEDVLVTFGV